MTYARARRITAALSTIFWVLVALALIWQASLPGRTWFSSLHDWHWVWLLPLLHGLLSLPFDWAAGHWLPRRLGQILSQEERWWPIWLRGSLVQMLFYAAFAAWLLLLGKSLGTWGAIGGMALAMLLLAGLQIWVARAVVAWESFFDNHKGKLVIYLDNRDAGFTGGISGIPGAEVFVLPNKYRAEMNDTMLKIVQGRRHGAVQTLTHARGFLVAFLFNVAAFSAAVLISPEGVATGQGLAATVGIYSLIQGLLGPLLLNWLSRRAVFEIDRWIYHRGGNADLLRQSFAAAVVPGESLPEQEPWATLFTGMPSPASRQQYMTGQARIRGAWQAAQQARFLSWAGLGLMSRSTETMLGRPERWVFQVSD